MKTQKLALAIVVAASLTVAGTARGQFDKLRQLTRSADTCKQIAYFKMKGVLTETPVHLPPLFASEPPMSLHSLLERFKDTKPHRDFHLFAYTAVQAGVARSLLERIGGIVAARNERAERAREMLRDVEAVTLPKVPPGARPAYNHCPLLMPDNAARDRAITAALDAGVECTTLYGRTIYDAYGLEPNRRGGGRRCPRAEDLADRLLLIPCHPLIPMDRVERAAEIVKLIATGG